MEEDESCWSLPEDGAGGSPQPQRGRKGRGGGKPAKSMRETKTCFASGCGTKCKANSKWCTKHDRDIAAIKFQAERDGELKAHESMCNDATKAAVFLKRFAEENEGCFRKKRIDWMTYKRSAGIRLTSTVREKESLFSVSEYVDMRKEKGFSYEQALAEWEAKLADPSVDREGSGANVELWLPKKKTRFRDTSKYIDMAMEEGSKAQKDPSAQDKSDLMEAISRTAPTQGDEWLRKAQSSQGGSSGSQAQGSAEEVAQVPSSKQRKAEIGIAAPKSFEKHYKTLPDLAKSIISCLELAQQALKGVPPEPQTDPLTVAYISATSCRQQLLQVWQAETLEEAQALSAEIVSLQVHAHPEAAEAGALPGSEAGVAKEAEEPKQPEAEEDQDGAGGTSAAGAATVNEQQPHAKKAKTESENGSVIDETKAIAKDGASVSQLVKDEAHYEAAADKRPSRPGSASKLPSPSSTKGSRQSEEGDREPSRYGGGSERISQHLQKCYQRAGTVAPLLAFPLSKLMSKVHMGDLLQSFLKSTSVEELDSKVSRYKEAVTLAKNLKDGCSKASASLRTNLNSKARSEKRKRDEEAKSKEREAQQVLANISCKKNASGSGADGDLTKPVV